jgi:phage shock protein C
MNTTTERSEADHPDRDHPDRDLTAPPRLCRPIHDRMLAGVAAGIAGYLGIDVAVVRIVLAVLAIAGGAGVPIYLAGWLLIPEEGSELSIASQFMQSHQPRSL